MPEGRTQPTRPYILYTICLFRTIFLLINYSLWDPNYICPRIFYFRDPISRLPFATSYSRLPFRDSHFATHTFATHICDSHLRPTFATRVRDSTRDSRSRLLIAPPTTTRYFLSRLLLCDSTTDGRNVLTPQCHLPSVPTLTLIKKVLEPSSWPYLHL